MSLRRALLALLAALGSIVLPARAFAADLILNNQTVTLSGTQTYNIVSLTNNSRIIVTPYNGTAGTGNLVIKANSITIDATSSIMAKGGGYQGALCANGAGPASVALAGGRGGCGVRDSGGGGAHRGGGGRGTKDCPGTGCVFPQYYEEDCVGQVNATNNGCVSVTDCRNNDALPTVAGLPYQHSIYAVEFGAAGGDKGCRDNDGFPPGQSLAAGNGGGRIVLFAANAGQTGQLTINGIVNANGNRGCAFGNDSAGGGSGGSVLLIGDNVTVGSTARVSAAGGRGGDSQPKCLTCSTNADCGNGQTCTGGRCSPCNCTPCTTNAQCNTALGQTCKNLGGDFGNVCANASNQCTPVPAGYEESECKSTQNNGLCDDCGGGGGGGIVNVLSRVASISPLATFDVSGAFGGVCPICTGEAGGGAGELQIDGAYVGEICDGYDNDFNGAVDDGLPPLNCNGNMLPSCVNGVPTQCPANVPACIGPVTDTRPRFLVVLDTSGSMLLDSNGYPTFGDGSVGHVGIDTSSDADTIGGNNSRISIAKGALNNVLAAFTDADFALARYHQDVSVNRSCQTASWFECQQSCCSYDDPTNNITPAFPIAPGCNLSLLYPSAGYPAALNANINIGWNNQGDCINYAGSCGAPRRGADVLVGFGKPLQQTLMWLDGKETSFNTSTIPGDHCNFGGGGDCELRATGPTPLADSLLAASDYLKPIIQCDGGVPCRKYSVILLTDGIESCLGDPVAAATALKTTVPGVTINTYVIGFSVLPSDQTQLNAIAAAGGTGTAFFANNQVALSNAIAGIVASSTNFEKCNGLDDNCNGLIDEDFPDKGQPCDNGLLGACKGTGVRVCNAAQNGTTCQITNPGQAPKAEICNGIDDNCNGLIDEGGVCQVCTPSPEVCNGIDDDCNGTVDDNPIDANQPCGLSLGECSPGITVCSGGVLGCAGAIGPQTEVCNGLDDDCDGVVDGMTTPCYAGPNGTLGVGVCHAGSKACTAVPGSGVPQFGACIGEVKPSPEICDGQDNDCNGMVDDQVSDGLGHKTGDVCCNFGSKCGVGVCTAGLYTCAGSQVVCNGGVGPSAEVCDGLDNDCNGMVDDVPGKGTPCVLAGGCPGMLDCQMGVGLVCVAAATGLEICNGIDDDCDGSIDEEPDVSTNDPTLGQPCDLPQAPNDQPPCKAGVTVCKGGQVVCQGAVTPKPEVCDGIDNDCNGSIDMPNPCPDGLICFEGQCLSACQPGEFPCPGGFGCMNGVCVPEAKDGGMSSSSGAGGGMASSSSGTTSSNGAGGGMSSSSGNTTSSSSSGSGMGGAGGGGNPDKDFFGLATGGGGCSCAVPERRALDPRLAVLCAVGLVAAARRRQRRAAKGGAR
ncbi:MAG: MopE-related protein [Minicystis sp.]